MPTKRTGDLWTIRKLYGEQMMHFCRSNFSTILETPGVLSSIITDYFAPSKELYSDLVSENKTSEFKKLVFNSYDFQNIESTEGEVATPEELLKKVGYNLYKCETEEDVQQFKKHYKKGEALCTFKGGRTNVAHVFFAVKENVDEIKREDFDNPDRQDLYGTSVISIQFSKDGTNFLSIKNRYNDKVANGDATFGNKLDEIIPGLTEAFEKKYGLIQMKGASNFSLNNYIRANDGKYYKYNYKINSSYFCKNNIVVDCYKVYEYVPKERFIIFDSFILNLEKKKIYPFTPSIFDSFLDEFKDIKKIDVKNEEDKSKRITIYFEKENKKPCELIIDNSNRIVSYKNENIKKVGKNFMYYNTGLKVLDIPNLEECDDYFLYNNTDLEELNISKVKKIGDYCLVHTNKIDSVNLSCVTDIGNDFFRNNQTASYLYAPLLTKVKNNFFRSNNVMKVVYLPFLRSCESNFFHDNEVMYEVFTPLLTSVKDNFCFSNNTVKEFFAPNLKSCGDSFFDRNNCFKELYAPCLEKCGNYFCSHNNSFKDLSLKSLKITGLYFFNDNNSIEKLYTPSLELCNPYFMPNNNKLTEAYFPSLVDCSDNFFENNESIQAFYADKLKKVGSNVLKKNKHAIMVMPSIKYYDGNSFNSHEDISRINAPLSVLYSIYKSNGGNVRELLSSVKNNKQNKIKVKKEINC